MKFSSSIYLSVLAALFSVSLCAPISGNPTKAPLRLDFTLLKSNETGNITNNIENNLTSQAFSKHIVNKNAVDSKGILDFPMENSNCYYYTEVEIGTPPQKIGLRVDINSGDIIVPGRGTDSYQGTFLSSLSSTYNHSGRSYTQTFGDQTYFKGNFSYDNINIGGSKIENVGFLLANDQTRGYRKLGLGFEEGEGFLEGKPLIQTFRLR